MNHIAMAETLLAEKALRESEKKLRMEPAGYREHLEEQVKKRTVDLEERQEQIIIRKNSKASVWGLRSSSGLSIATAAVPGRKDRSDAAQRFTFRCLGLTRVTVDEIWQAWGYVNIC